MADGKIYYTAGVSRSGKTTQTFDRVRNSKRLIVWNVKGDFARELKNVHLFTDIKSLFNYCNKMKGKPLRVAFQSVTLNHFDTWAKIAYALSQFSSIDIVCDEASDVNNAGKAVGWWGVLIRQVLCTGSNVHVICQRPATNESDSLGNASVVSCFRLTKHSDRKMMAENIDEPIDKILSLQQFEFIEKDMHSMTALKKKTRKPRAKA